MSWIDIIKGLGTGIVDMVRGTRAPMYGPPLHDWKQSHLLLVCSECREILEPDESNKYGECYPCGKCGQCEICQLTGACPTCKRTGLGA